MNRALFFSRCYYWLICFAVLSAPFSAIPYFFITPLLLILWIIEGDWKRKWNCLKKSQNILILCALLSFWLINIIGLFYSNDLVRGLMRTYDKLPFVVYPLLFFTLDKNFFTKEKLHILLKIFLYAASTMLLISWGNAWTQFIKTGETSYFYYLSLSHYFGHPAYCTLTVCIAFSIAFYFFNHDTAKNRWRWVILLFFFAISVYFFQSRGGNLAFLFMLLFSIFYYVHTHKKNYWYGVTGASIIVLFAVSLWYFFPNRIDFNKEQITDKSIVENVLGLRKDIWRVSWNIAIENKMFGIGTGYDTDSYLSDEELKFFKTNHSFINTHNQFLQIFLEHGILGFCVFIFLVIYSFYYALKTKNYLLLMLLLALTVNILFESMLERNRGIFTISLCYCLFITIKL